MRAAVLTGLRFFGEAATLLAFWAVLGLATFMLGG